jgi:hypothetical protein
MNKASRITAILASALTGVFRFHGGALASDPECEESLRQCTELAMEIYNDCMDSGGPESCQGEYDGVMDGCVWEFNLCEDAKYCEMFPEDCC